MPQSLIADEIIYDFEEAVANLVTEDDEPVDNIISDKQMRLLVEPLYTSWKPTDEETQEARSFIAAADVGIFTSPRQSPIVPDVLISLDVETDLDFYDKNNRSYFVWEYGKVPEVVVEIVSNKKGNELESKMKRYQKMAISYYVVFDPLKQLGDDVLRVYELGFGGRRYHLRKDHTLPNVNLNLKLWNGEFEGKQFEWIRWCDENGNLLLTGRESAESERQRAEKFAAKLLEMGIDPENI